MIDNGIIDENVSEFEEDPIEGMNIHSIDEDSEIAKLTEMGDDFFNEDSKDDPDPYDRETLGSGDPYDSI